MNSTENKNRIDNPLDLFIADPFVIEDKGVYYLYGTDELDASRGVPVYSSTDMKYRVFSY